MNNQIFDFANKKMICMCRAHHNVINYIINGLELTFNANLLLL